MSALYAMRYHAARTGHGAVYIGKGIVLGVDATGARYNGSYTIQGENLTGTVTLIATGGALVTGQIVPKGTKVQIVLNLPPDLGNGEFQQVMVDGRPVRVAFDKIGDIP